MMIKILLVEDDDFIANVVGYYLNTAGKYQLDCAKTAGEAMSCIRNSYDLILLDILLPDDNGINLCQQIRKWHNCPILFISCLDDDQNIIRALNAGGDDFITKPFDNKILEARIQANLRRVELDRREEPQRQIVTSIFSLEPETHTVVFPTQKLTLSTTEYKLLSFLVLHKGKCYPAKELYEQIWGYTSYGDARTVVVHIYNLRKKLTPYLEGLDCISNLPGKGYTFWLPD
ncbi:response regulator transcription factor [Desulfitobacterium chlororespirans]|nr:response regulator transcription factor [Desulfitobacterium chlororespirans]